MSCLGVHFALTDAQRDKLLSMNTDEERKYLVSDEFEDDWNEDFVCETDNAWDAIHRVLTEYPPHHPKFDLDAGEEPRKLAILGGRKLMNDEDWYIIRLIDAEKVPAVAEALNAVTEDEFAKKYLKHCEGAWPEYGEDDLGYSWAYFGALRDFFNRVKDSGRCVIFTVDQ